MMRDDSMSAGREISDMVIESTIQAKLGGRLRQFHVDGEDGQLILRGQADSYHVKQLVQQEVMGLTSRRIRANRIEVVGRSPAVV